jgi:hypothetical protein
MPRNPNSFKSWLHESDPNKDMFAGVTAVKNTVADAFSKGYGGQQAKAAVANAKAVESNRVDMIKDINQHVASMFSKFPNPDEVGSPEALLAKYESRESALQAFAIYKNMAKTLTEIQEGFNKRLLQTKKIAKPQLDNLLKSAKQDANSGILDGKIEDFAKSEAKFFTDLLRIPEVEGKSDKFDDLTVDKSGFVSRISNRFGKTSPNKIAMTITALNTLFIYLITEFTQYAKTIGEAGKQRPKSEK